MRICRLEFRVRDTMVLRGGGRFVIIDITNRGDHLE